MSYDPNEMMLELFRSEVDSHSDTLSKSLLQLEQSPDDSALLEGMMRAAHSIKGAARIVGVEPAVEISHAMEDCFVAAQRGNLVIRPAAIDVLLRSVDLLIQVSDASKDAAVDWSHFQAVIQSNLSNLKLVLRGEHVESTVPQIETAATTPVLEIPNQACRIECPAYLNATSAEHLRLDLLKHADRVPRAIELDLALTENIDSIGLAFLDAALRFGKDRSIDISIVNVSSMIRRVLECVGIHSRDSEE